MFGHTVGGEGQFAAAFAADYPPHRGLVPRSYPMFACADLAVVGPFGSPVPLAV